MAKKSAKAPAKKQAPTKSAPAPKKAAAKAKPTGAAKPSGAAKPASKGKPVATKPAAKGSPAKASKAAPAAPVKKAAPEKEGVAAKLLSVAKSLLNGKGGDKETAPKKGASVPKVEGAASAPVDASVSKPLKLVAASSEGAPAKAEAAKPVREGRVLSAVREERERPARMTKASKAEKIAQGEDEAKWIEYHERFKGDKAPTYDMKATFAAGGPIQHKLLGWGWVLSNENDRLEVLFKDGRRMLISNYNPER